MGFFSREASKKGVGKNSPRFLRKKVSIHRESREMKSEEETPLLPASLLFLWAVFLAVSVYIAFFSIYFLVEPPVIRGASAVPSETLSEAVESRLEGEWLGVFPKRNFFLLQPHLIEEELRADYPLLGSVRVNRVFPNQLSIDVSEREKILLWCVSDPGSEEPLPENLADTCFLIDEEGRTHVNSRALAPENSASVIFILDISGKTVLPGERVFDPAYGTFIIRMNEVFSERFGLALEPRFISVSRFADEVRVKTREGWEVYVSATIPLESSLDALALLFEKELPQERRVNLAYVDLRVENRIFYAFREGEGTETPPVDSSAPVKEEEEDEPKEKKKR